MKLHFSEPNYYVQILLPFSVMCNSQPVVVVTFKSSHKRCFIPNLDPPPVGMWSCWGKKCVKYWGSVALRLGCFSEVCFLCVSLSSQIRIRDPNQGGRDITEEIMAGGSGSRNSTPPVGRPSSTPTPPQVWLAWTTCPPLAYSSSDWGSESSWGEESHLMKLCALIFSGLHHLCGRQDATSVSSVIFLAML